MPSQENFSPEPKFMELAVRLATENVRKGAGGPFGAVVVRNGEIVAEAVNSVTAANDPTAHAEINAIRAACKALASFQLTGCEVYTSCEPCPMCMAALYWARPSVVYYANTKSDAAQAGFDDSFIYSELALPPDARQIRVVRILDSRALDSFKEWTENQLRIDY